MNTRTLSSINATSRVNGIAAGVAGVVIAPYPFREMASGAFPKHRR